MIGCIFGAFLGWKCVSTNLGCLATVSDCVDYHCSPEVFMWMVLGVVIANRVGACRQEEEEEDSKGSSTISTIPTISSEEEEEDEVPLPKGRKRKRYPCPDCPADFRCPANLKEHRDAVHLGIRYTCDICSITCSTKSALRRHKRNQH